MVRLRFVAISLATLTFMFACQKAPEEATTEQVVEARPTLIGIMQALSVDMADIAQGIWTEDYAAIREAALRIANHPPVTEKQKTLIQGTLGSDFGAFVAGDQLVHRTALELADVAPGSIETVLETYERLQQGCVACHSSFRLRVATATTDAED